MLMFVQGAQYSRELPERAGQPDCGVRLSFLNCSWKGTYKHVLLTWHVDNVTSVFKYKEILKLLEHRRLRQVWCENLRQI